MAEGKEVKRLQTAGGKGDTEVGGGEEKLLLCAAVGEKEAAAVLLPAGRKEERRRCRDDAGQKMRAGSSIGERRESYCRV